jgi:hypothetical protein
MPCAPKWSHNGLVEFTFRLGRERLYPHPAVVTTGPASADADYDNGTTLHNRRRSRRCDDDCATHRIAREAREEAKAGHRLIRLSTAARDCRPAREVFLCALLSSTEGEDNPRVVVVAIVLVHRADLPESVKTRPWRLRIDRLAQLSEEPHLLLIPEHQLAS